MFCVVYIFFPEHGVFFSNIFVSQMSRIKLAPSYAMARK